MNSAEILLQISAGCSSLTHQKHVNRHSSTGAHETVVNLPDFAV
jgi:hypothetical protein